MGTGEPVGTPRRRLADAARDGLRIVSDAQWTAVQAAPERHSRASHGGQRRPARCAVERLGGGVLRPVVVMAVIDGVLDAMRPGGSGDLERLRAELRQVEREIERLTQAIVAGGSLESLVGALKGKEARRSELATLIAAREAVSVRRFDRRAIDRDVRDSLARWRAMLTKHVQDGANCCGRCSRGRSGSRQRHERIDSLGSWRSGSSSQGRPAHQPMKSDPRGSNPGHRD